MGILCIVIVTEKNTKQKVVCLLAWQKHHAPSSDKSVVLRRAHHTGFDDVSERIQVLLSSAHNGRGHNGQSQVRLGC